jgi:hypothetical protein
VIVMKNNVSKSVVTSSTATSAATTDANSAVASTTVPPETANIPSVTEAEVAAFVSAVDTFAVLLGSGFTVPQPEDVKRLVKPRKTAPIIVPLVADLSTRYGVASTAYPANVTLAKQAVVNSLAPVVERIAAVQKLVKAVVTVGQSAAWQGSMVTYGLLKSEARGNAVLRSALAPVREKLRLTYETEDGGTTKIRSRSKAATAKAAAASAAKGASAPVETAPAAAAPVTTAPPASATAPAKSS